MSIFECSRQYVQRFRLFHGDVLPPELRARRAESRLESLDPGAAARLGMQHKLDAIKKLLTQVPGARARRQQAQRRARGGCTKVWWYQFWLYTVRLWLHQFWRTPCE